MSSEFLSSIDERIERLSDEERKAFGDAYQNACLIGLELDAAIERRDEIKVWIAANLKASKYFYWASVAFFSIASVANAIEMTSVSMLTKLFVTFGIAVFGVRNELFAFILQSDLSNIELKIRLLNNQPHIKFSDLMYAPYSERDRAHDKRIINSLLLNVQADCASYPDSLSFSFLTPD